ncbi:hypothetical protein J1N35_011095 [Gossypium stocksii]|uniref:Uncharacterized protein n=1 Tax=Gossypium stocksii TaxID=47602 RepID=A0A9D3W2W8_9ROSI|nr:hypothetical protein J1N35_011095 [Gossypium stocksii]
MPRLALPVWPTWPGLESTRPFGMLVYAHTSVWPTRPTWPSPCDPYGHTPATTRPCLTHDHAFVDPTAMSSHTVNHTARHTSMWRRQNGFSTFAESYFSAFRLHT